MILNDFFYEKRYKMGIFVVSLTTLFYEILLTRIFSVIVYYHFASLAIALALLGLSFGAILYYFIQKYVRDNCGYIIFYSFILYCLSFIFIFLMFIYLSRNPERISHILNYFRYHSNSPTQSLIEKFDFYSYLILLFSFFLILLPFIFSGFLSGLFLSLSFFEIEKIYFWNLFGTSLGCIFIFLFLPIFGVPNLFLFICIFGLLSGVTLLSFIKKEKIILILVSIPILILFAYSLSVNSIKINFGRARLTDALISRWNSYSHIAVYPFQGDMEMRSSWGLSPDYTGSVPPHLNMVINEADYTQIIKFDGDFSKLEFLKNDLISIPYYLVQFPKVLIIGPGGGKDILLAKLFNAKQISAVELNSLVIDLVENEFKEFSGGPYSLQNVEAVVADARNYVMKSSAKYDLITALQIYAFMDPIASAFSFAENYLFTKEAFVDYLNHLTQGGMLTITKLFIPEERLRFFSLARAALESAGEKNFSKHLLLVRSRRMDIFMVKKEEFNTGEIEKIKELCIKKQFDLVFYPGMEGEGDIFKFVNEKDTQQFYEKYPLDISPSTDDRPFFSDFLKPKDFWMGHWPKVKRVFLLKVIFILRKFLFLFLFINILLIAVFALKKKNLNIPSYFSMLGVGYMLVEITLMRKFIFFLGHPVYAVTVILFSLLFFNAIGSLMSKRIAGILKNKLLIFVALFLLLIMYSYPLDKIFINYYYLNIYLKIVLTVIMIFPLGYLMGMPFPLGLILIKEEDREVIPYIWAINGASSVFGALLALVLSMSVGYNLTFLLAGLIYLLAGILVNKKNNIL